MGVSFCPAGVQCQILNVVGCEIFTTKYYNDMGVSSCSNCPSGFNKVTKSITVPGCSNEITYYDCEQPCIECPDCESTDWTSLGGLSGYEKKVTATCNKVSCLCRKTTSYRCRQGFYGTSNSLGTSGCIQCPYIASARAKGSTLWFMAYGSTPSAGNGYELKDCYAPVIYDYKDSVGIYDYSQECWYSM